ncbi:actin-like ATPase domain-containing protein [Crepidotus variabilis]|uniref:Actin-like ATPase domain-containing protein n=1 Tax=Crepidotus variabilis TaxID=179855 RepID=A0A9P6E9E2_9AGAR|nr:actin-like ATPase domain-containing protein [Crepidotus variabilis]
MSTSPTTPRAKSSYAPSTPATSRVQASSHAVHASPHYATTRRHSLYGVEDRVIIDPGSRIWKVGFSGEGRPRDVFCAGGLNSTSLWKLKRPADAAERAEEDNLLELRLQDCLRSVFHDSLLADPKARKVILIEHPLLPLYVKEMIARILFENQVPSISFASSHLLSLLAVGRITGLVVDSGHLESVALPIFAARPMFPQIQTTPTAGAHFTSHLRALLLMFATYLPPPASLTAGTSAPAANRATRVPEEVLTDAVVEDIKTRCCFVGSVLGRSNAEPKREETPRPEDDLRSEMDTPPDSDVSESMYDSDNSTVAPSIASGSRSQPDIEPSGENHLQAIAKMYKRHSAATDLQMRVLPPPSQRIGTGRGTLIIPGWIRERASEVLFEGGDVDESSLAELILDTLLKVPRDLRKTMASSLLLTGGTAMLPGFIPRLQEEIIRALSTPPPSPSKQLSNSSRSPPPPYDKYSALRPLLPYIAILNNPNPPISTSERAQANAGKAPAFAPALMAWVGGSLAGALKTGGAEVAREKWDEMDDLNRAADESMDISPDTGPTGAVSTPQKAKNILPDWTRSPLPTGAPSARALTAISI